MEKTDIRTGEITLGEQTYKVRELSYKRGRKFWPIIAEQLKPVIESFSNAKEISASMELKDLMALWPALERLVLESPEAALNALCSYSPELETAREQIEEEATDRQIIDALWKLIEMADPFGMRRLIARAGLGGGTTSPSSPPPNGTSGS